MYLLGIDGGTEAIKAALFDLQGNLTSVAAKTYTTYFPRPGWAEQDPDEWWSSLITAVKVCLEKANVSLNEIKGICADATTCTLLPIKANGEHLRRALLWMDVRATEQATRIFETGHEALRYTLAGASAEWMPAKTLWLKECESETYVEADYLIEYTDWLAYKLTGRIAHNLNTVTQRWYYHKPTGGWQHDFFEAIGLAGVEKKFPKDVLAIGENVGTLSSYAASELGLPAGIPVAMGGGDAFIGLLGLGVTEPGDAALVTGSSNAISALSSEGVHYPGIFGSFPDAVLPGLSLLEGGQVSTGSILNWFKRNFASDVESEVKGQGVSVYDLLDSEASKIPVGSEGLIVLDYFQGNRTPHTDSLARGMLFGLSLQATRGHVFRALREGIAYGLKDIIDTFINQGCAISRLIACGGATQSKLFMQIYADVLGQTIYTTREREASLLSCAVAAAYGAGLYPSLTAASKAMVKPSSVYQPDKARHEAYKFYAQKYKELYTQVRPVMHEVSRHVMKAENA